MRVDLAAQVSWNCFLGHVLIMTLSNYSGLQCTCNRDRRIAKLQNHNQIVRYEYHQACTFIRQTNNYRNFLSIEPLLIPVSF